jgi:hypothetical protein
MPQDASTADEKAKEEEEEAGETVSTFDGAPPTINVRYS